MIGKKPGEFSGLDGGHLRPRAQRLQQRLRRSSL
jgi:hypothetical protein